MSVQSIKARIGGGHLGPMTDLQLIKLFTAMREDLVTLTTTVTNLNSAVQNIKTNCSNATVNINVVTSANLNTQL